MGNLCYKKEKVVQYSDNYNKEIYNFGRQGMNGYPFFPKDKTYLDAIEIPGILIEK